MSGRRTYIQIFSGLNKRTCNHNVLKQSKLDRDETHVLLMSCRASVAFSREREPVTRTEHPRAPRSLAVDWPMPLVDPVISAVLPASDIFCTVFIPCGLNQTMNERIFIWSTHITPQFQIFNYKCWTFLEKIVFISHFLEIYIDLPL